VIIHCLQQGSRNRPGSSGFGPDPKRASGDGRGSADDGDPEQHQTILGEFIVKKFLKFIGYGFLGLIVLGVVASMAGGNEEADTNTPAVEENATQAKETANKPKEEPKETKKDDKNTVTLENYEKITVGDSLTGEGGMTIEEVTAIFGKKPDTKSESQSGDMKMIMADWTADGWNNLGDNVAVTFINGKASGKSQFGLDE
jgi:uncharacterized protein YxeA